MLDDLIAKWHQTEGTSGDPFPLHEYLGLLWWEYKLYVDVGFVPYLHPNFGIKRMKIDFERLARCAELSRQIWPNDEVSVGANADGRWFVAGVKHIMFAIDDMDMFEQALLMLHNKQRGLELKNFKYKLNAEHIMDVQLGMKPVLDKHREDPVSLMMGFLNLGAVLGIKNLNATVPELVATFEQVIVQVLEKLAAQRPS